MSDENGERPSLAVKVAIGVAAIAIGTLAVAVTGGGAAAAFPTMVSSLKVTAASTAIGAGGGAITNRMSTGSWNGTREALLNGAADGFMWGSYCRSNYSSVSLKRIIY